MHKHFMFWQMMHLQRYAGSMVTDDTLARANAVLGNQQAADRLRGQALDTYRRIGASWWAARLAGWPVICTGVSTVKVATELVAEP